MPVKAFLYDTNGSDGQVSLNASTLANLTDRQLLWVDLAECDDTEIRQIADLIELPLESAYGLLQPVRRPRLDNYGDFFQVVIETLQVSQDQFKIVELDFIIKKNLILTIHRKPIDFLESFDHRIKGDSELGKLDADEFFASLLDWHVSSFFRILEQLEVAIDKLDERALRIYDDPKLLADLGHMRKKVALIRRVITPHREVYAALTRPDLSASIRGGYSAVHFVALRDRLEKVIDAVENARDLLIGSFEIHMTQTAQRTNHIMKTLTLVSVILLPMTAITGIMSMNFKANLYQTGNPGFWSAILAMGVIAFGMIFFARRNRWL